MNILIDVQDKVVLYIIILTAQKLEHPLPPSDVWTFVIRQLATVLSLLISQYCVIVNLKQLLSVCYVELSSLLLKDPKPVSSADNAQPQDGYVDCSSHKWAWCKILCRKKYSWLIFHTTKTALIEFVLRLEKFCDFWGNLRQDLFILMYISSTKNKTNCRIIPKKANHIKRHTTLSEPERAIGVAPHQPPPPPRPFEFSKIKISS